MMANGTNQDDAIIIAYRALLLHPRVFKSDKLIKNEMEALSMWNRAERLGLSDQDAAGLIWAQVVKGLFNCTVMKDSAFGTDYLQKYNAWKGNGLAHYNLGLIYQQGLGINQDFQNAREQFEVAAKMGHASVQVRIASLYHSGLGGFRDQRKAKEYYAYAAAQH